MRKNIFIITMVCLAIFILQIFSFAQSPDRIKLVKGSKQYLLKFTGTDMVKVSNLQTVFRFTLQPGRGTSSIKVNGMEYSNGLTSQDGELYVPLKKFMDFFLVDSQKTGALTWTVNDEGILNTDLISEEEVYITPAGGNAVKMATLNINDNRFVDLDKFASETGKKIRVNPILGTAFFNEKPIYRWMKYNNNNYAFLDDLAAAFGGKIALGTDNKSEQNAKAKQDILNNVTVSFEGQKQYMTENEQMPRGYTILVKVSNDFYTPLPIDYNCIVLVDKNGKEYQGNIMVYGGARPASEFLDNSSRSKFTDTSNTIKPRSTGYVTGDFTPPKDMEPDHVMFRYKGIVLMKQDIDKVFDPDQKY